ncbi:putative ribonuclease H-like domain-containing protein, partial [Tanacetum coccineum]
MRNSPDFCSVDSPICVYDQDRVLNSRLEVSRLQHFKISRFVNSPPIFVDISFLRSSVNSQKTNAILSPCLEEFKELEVNEYGPRDSSLKPTTGCDKESDNSKENTDDSLEQHQMTNTQTSSCESPLKVDKDWKEKFFYPVNHVESVNKIEKLVRKPVKYAEMYSCPNQQRKRIVSGNNYNKKDNGYYSKTSHPSAHKHMAQRAVLMKIGLKSFNTARPVNTVRSVNIGRPFSTASGCSRHMTGNIAHLSDFKDFDGGYVTFGGGAYGGRITGKGTIKTDNLDFDDVYFVKELKFNLFSVSQMCDKKNYVLFTDSECLVLSPNFKLPDENQILLKIPRQDNMYSFDMKNIVPKDSLTCLVAKATSEESMLWHRRLGHINFKNINKLVKENLVRDLPLKRFENDQTCVACLKGKQHRASCKTKAFNPITKPLFMLHMDLFGPTFGKGIKREYSVARTPQQNGVAERNNRTLIEAARTMLADSKLPTTFWAEAVYTACYPFGCHVTILNTLDKLGKFDGKSDEGFFVGYSLSSKAFRVYNIRTRKVQENLHVGFLENKPMLEGNGPKWLFDLDSLTQSMNYVPVVAGTFSNVSAGIQGGSESSISSQQDQDCIFMPIWKDASYFDDASLKSVNDAQLQDQDGTHDDCNFQDNGIDDQQVNTASPPVNTALASPEQTATGKDFSNPFIVDLLRKDDELWKNQDQYNLLSWSLYDFCGIHMLLMENGMAIHMLTKKKYPLSQAMLTKRLSRKLEVDHESLQAFELL